MPNTREKLMELMKSGGVRDFPFNAALADHLIAHGVTVQEWIPVTERLPSDDDVLIVVNGRFKNTICKNAILMGAYCEDENIWFVNEFPDWEDAHVSHWMPLPEPPKEIVP